MKKEIILISDDDSDFDAEEKISNLSIYEIYASDVASIPCLDTEKNMLLLHRISDIINELDKLFLVLGFDSLFFENKRITWLADKIDYCLNNCKNNQLLKQIKNVYDKYLLVSSKIIEGNLRLVIEIAGNYKENSLFSFEDIIQYGNLGLIKAVEKYKLDCGTAFSTYAGIWINQLIRRNIRGFKSTYRIPSNVVYDGYDLMKKQNELDLILGRESSIDELAKYMGLTSSRIEELKQYFYDPISLDESFYSAYGDIEMTRGDMIADPNVDVCMDGIYSSRIENLKEELRKRLTSRQFEFISKYIGIDGIDYNIEEIAAFMNISQQRVSQLKCETIKRLSLMPAFISKTLY